MGMLFLTLNYQPMPYIMVLAAIIWLIYSYSNKTKQKVLAKIIVTEAALNDDPFITITLVDNVYFQFYRVGNGQLTFSGVMTILDEQYFGYISEVDEAMLFSKAIPKEHELYSFNWSFVSTKNNNASSALVKLIRSPAKERISIDLAILYNDNNRFFFKGYIDTH